MWDLSRFYKWLLQFLSGLSYRRESVFTTTFMPVNWSHGIQIRFHDRQPLPPHRLFMMPTDSKSTRLLTWLTTPLVLVSFFVFAGHFPIIPLRTTPRNPFDICYIWTLYTFFSRVHLGQPFLVPKISLVSGTATLPEFPDIFPTNSADAVLLRREECDK